MVVKEDYISIEVERMETKLAIQGRALIQKNKYKGPEVRTHLACSRTRKNSL